MLNDELDEYMQATIWDAGVRLFILLLVGVGIVGLTRTFFYIYLVLFLGWLLLEGAYFLLRRRQAFVIAGMETHSAQRAIQTHASSEATEVQRKAWEEVEQVKAEPAFPPFGFKPETQRETKK